MSDRMERLSESIGARLNEMAARIQQFHDAITAPVHIGRAVLAKLDKAKQRVEARKVQFQNERSRVNSKIKRDLAAALTKIQQWKVSHDAEKLSRHADHVEQYALAAILDACDAIDKAEVAALEALDARLTAEEIAKDGSA
jgi:hypothetical protein